MFIAGSDRDWCLFWATFAGQQSGFSKEENGFVGTRPMKPLHAPVSKAALTCSVLCSLDFGRSGIATVTLLTSLHVANPWRPIPKLGRARNVCSWQILLQKSATADGRPAVR
jgi:hypothetical protein